MFINPSTLYPFMTWVVVISGNSTIFFILSHFDEYSQIKKLEIISALLCHFNLSCSCLKGIFPKIIIVSQGWFRLSYLMYGRIIGSGALSDLILDLWLLKISLGGVFLIFSPYPNPYPNPMGQN